MNPVSRHTFISEIDEDTALFVHDEGLRWGSLVYVRGHDGLRDVEQGCAAGIMRLAASGNLEWVWGEQQCRGGGLISAIALAVLLTR